MMITAHSGSDGYPDNSLEFIQAMVDSQVPAFEIDLQLSPQGDLYLAHDPLDNWQSAVTLDMCYQAMRSNPEMIINVDCKNPQAGPLALRLAESYGIKDQIVLSGSLPLDFYTTEEYGQLFYNLENIPKIDQVAPNQFEQILHNISQQGIEIVQLYHGLVDQELVDLLTRCGLKLSVWTVNNLTEIDYYFDLGCYNVTSRVALDYLEHR